ncbi:hypothetical protein M5689_005379 [Euphorbia peplus]|nr:hypothetical protein M5689_005379 [Euphorbia peplus]
MRGSSRMQTGDHAGGGSESHKLKFKRIHKMKKKKKKKQRVSRGGDASHGQIDLGSESHLVKCEGLKEKKRPSRVKMQVPMDVCLKPHSLDPHTFDPVAQRYERIKMCHDLDIYNGRIHAKMALKFYQKNQKGAKFELVEVINAQFEYLTHPTLKFFQVWYHISFIAQPKNAESSDVSQKYFFAELKKDDYGGEFKAIYCSTFELSDLGCNHGCIFCSPALKLHPCNGYNVGNARSGWKIAEFMDV